MLGGEKWEHEREREMVWRRESWKGETLVSELVRVVLEILWEQKWGADLGKMKSKVPELGEKREE